LGHRASKKRPWIRKFLTSWTSPFYFDVSDKPLLLRRPGQASSTPTSRDKPLLLRRPGQATRDPGSFRHPLAPFFVILCLHFFVILRVVAGPMKNQTLDAATSRSMTGLCAEHDRVEYPLCRAWGVEAFLLRRPGQAPFIPTSRTSPFYSDVPDKPLLLRRPATSPFYSDVPRQAPFTPTSPTSPFYSDVPGQAPFIPTSRTSNARSGISS
jgi:hypothetical protein